MTKLGLSFQASELSIWEPAKETFGVVFQVVASDEAAKIEPDNVIVINPEENSEEDNQLKTKMEERY